MLMYNLIEFSNNSKTSGGLWHQYRDESVEGDVAIRNSKSFKSKVKVTGKIPVDGNTKNVDIAVPLKFLTNFLENS